MEKDNLEMILEDINGKFDLVLEGYAALDKKLDDRFDELNEKIENNSFKIEILNQKIDGVEEKLTEKIEGVEKRLTAKIEGVEEKLTAKIEGVEEKLTAKIEGVEAKQTRRGDGLEQKLSNKLDALAEDLSAHRRDTEVHRSYQVRED